MKGNGNQFDDIHVFIKPVKAFDCRFLFYLLLCYIQPCKRCFQLQHLTLFAKTIRVFLNADTSPIYLYIVIAKYEYTIYLINFIYCYCTATWKSKFCFNWSLDFFSSFFCMIIPKKGIFYWDTSTSFVINCANEHVQTLIASVFMVFHIHVFVWIQNALWWKKKNNTRELHMFKVLFTLGVVPAQQNSLLWDTVGTLVEMNVACMKT